MQWSNLVKRDYLSNHYFGKGSFSCGLECTCISTWHSVSLPGCHCAHQHGPSISILSLTSPPCPYLFGTTALALGGQRSLLFWHQLDTLRESREQNRSSFVSHFGEGSWKLPKSQFAGFCKFLVLSKDQSQTQGQNCPSRYLQKKINMGWSIFFAE